MCVFGKQIVSINYNPEIFLQNQAINHKPYKHVMNLICNETVCITIHDMNLLHCKKIQKEFSDYRMIETLLIVNRVSKQSNTVLCTVYLHPNWNLHVTFN